MTQRKMKQEREQYFGELEGRLVDVIASLQAEVDRLGADVRFDKERGYDYGGCYECGGSYDEWYLVYERAETDAEMQKREKAAEKARATRAAKKAKDAAAKEAKDRKEFERLRKKFGEG